MKANEGGQAQGTAVNGRGTGGSAVNGPSGNASHKTLAASRWKCFNFSRIPSFALVAGQGRFTAVLG